MRLGQNLLVLIKNKKACKYRMSEFHWSLTVCLTKEKHCTTVSERDSFMRDTNLGTSS